MTVGSIQDANVLPARELRFRLHLRRMRRKLDRLRRNGRSNPSVLAILAVETFYRPLPMRMLEYASWFLLSALKSSSASGLTVGIGQAQLLHWRDLGLLESDRFSVDSLARVRDLESNYEVCRAYLSRRRMLSVADPAALGVAYAGGPRRQYSRLLERALTAVEG